MFKDNNIVLNIQPTEEALSLIRLIISFYCQYLDFDIDEVDRLKFSVTSLIQSLKPFWIDQDSIKIQVSYKLEEIVMKLSLPANSEHKTSINLDNENIKIIKALVDELTFENNNDKELVFQISKTKRNKYG